MSQPERTSVARSPRRGYAHWRAASLTLVYVLITAHIIHWLIAGKTLAPLELNEVMYTLELGIVTAGFVFMTIALLATAVFGRFFCSWGCHILALQDLCTWILRKLNIRRPRGIRSRVLLWVPLGAALYMFAWPQVVRLWEGRDLPELRVTVDRDGWASFATEDFWRNLPGPGVALITFAVCGFLIVYVLGSRGFCTYGCPYGALFRVADRVAPGRIRAGPNCIQCGACTAACPSHVRVHEELARYGMVVDPACLKDLNCVAVCPQRSVHFGFGRPGLIRTTVSDTAVHRIRDFTWWEEAIMAVVFLPVLMIYRGLYEKVPFLLSIAVGAIGAYLCIVFLRLLRQPEVELNRVRLKQHGRILAAGWLFSAAMGLAVLATVHSAAVRYHIHQGRRHFNLARQADADGPHTTTALAHLETADRWGLLPTGSTNAMLAELYVRRERWAEAREHLQRILVRAPDDVGTHLQLAGVMTAQGRRERAWPHYQAALAAAPDHAETHYRVAGFFFAGGRSDRAVHHLREALRLQPALAEAHCELGAILIEQGDLAASTEHLRQAISLRPDFSDAHYNLAVALAMSGRMAEAAHAIDRALVLKPNDPQTHAFHAHLRHLTSRKRGAD